MPVWSGPAEMIAGEISDFTTSGVHHRQGRLRIPLAGQPIRFRREIK